MNKVSKTIVGIPLKQTNPASIERFLEDRVRDALGDEFQDLATIRPMLRVDQEDGDLSGNVTDGFGTVTLDIQGQKIHLPFIIHQKEFIPFDTIRFGEQTIPYSISHLRKVVNGIDKHVKENSDGDEGAGSAGEKVVDPRDVPTQNGFLGDIMQIRDQHRSEDSAGVGRWEGAAFGDVDDSRIMKTGSADIDIFDILDETVEKIASTKIYSEEDVNQYIGELEKKAEEESENHIEQASDVDATSGQAGRVRRGFNKMENEDLVDISRVRSGNNIKFPVVQNGRFEYRSGRVYHKFEPWVKDRLPKTMRLKSLVLDHGHGYRMLAPNDKFMTTAEEPNAFEFNQERAKGLEVGHRYVAEVDEQTLSLPFEVTESRRRIYEEEQGMLMFSDEYHPKDIFDNSLFLNSFTCNEVIPSFRKPSTHKIEDYTRPTVSDREFAIVITTDPTLTDVIYMTEADLSNYIKDQAKSPEDEKMAKDVARAPMVNDFFLVPQKLLFFKMEENIQGYFTRPDGYFKEGPLSKTASTRNMNAATLMLEKDSKPRSYAVRWQYMDQDERDNTSSSSSVKRHEKRNLSERSARKLLQDLGYNHQKLESFFEITHRNGRQAHFDLPSIEKAKNADPSASATQKARNAMNHVLNGTLNANNFTPMFEDVIAEQTADALANGVPKSVTWSKKWEDIKKTSHDVAYDMEKTAETFQGNTWYEIAALTNLKHRLDKYAHEIASGGYAVEGEKVFEKVAGIEPIIEKHAADLIEFNRKQILNFGNRMPVDPRLVKQAVEELEGLHKYATFAERKKKLNNELDKEAGIFHSKLNQRWSELADQIEGSQGRMNQLNHRKGKEYIRYRANADGGDAARAQEAEGNIANLNQELEGEMQNFRNLLNEKAEIEQKKTTRNLGAGTLVGLPSIAGGSYAYADWKDEQ